MRSNDPLNDQFEAERHDELEERSDMTIEYEESSKSADESDSGSEIRRMITDELEQPDDTVHSLSLIHI